MEDETGLPKEVTNRDIGSCVCFEEKDKN